jgi:hypothetical protein
MSGQLHFTARGSHWIGGWVGPRVGLDAVKKIKNLHCRESNTGRPARRYTYWPISVPKLHVDYLFNSAFIMEYVIQSWMTGQFYIVNCELGVMWKGSVTAGLSNAESAGAMAPVIYFPGALIYSSLQTNNTSEPTLLWGMGHYYCRGVINLSSLNSPLFHLFPVNFKIFQEILS